jgi:hypothetical protein
VRRFFCNSVARNALCAPLDAPRREYERRCHHRLAKAGGRRLQHGRKRDAAEHRYRAAMRERESDECAIES